MWYTNPLNSTASKNMKRIAILGSTGSIGKNALHIARHLGDEVQVIALAAHSNIDLLEEQARDFHPDLVAVYDESMALELQKRMPHQKIVAGMDGLKAVAAHSDVDFVVSAISGTIGLVPTLAAIQAGKDVGLANKESLVSGGALVMALVKEKGVRLIPIDSEHSAIFQCLNGEKRESVRRIILTASGGPFRSFSDEQMSRITVDDALRHPTWNMGKKVTIDSSTLMNKGLEMIEARWLFDLPVSKIEVVIHPQSIIHSMVEFADLSILAQMGEPNMKTPIQYAMTYPDRYPGLLKPFDFVKNSKLEFYAPDMEKFRCLALAFDAIEEGGSLPCYMNGANEVLVQRFINREIGWREIGTKLERLMTRHSIKQIASLDSILAVDALARQEAQES
jgi:1-deoxy-D-xylulose-5-phosphate reductoisomerase